MNDQESRQRRSSAGRNEGRPDHIPFNTIENVDIVDVTHIIVADDNNLPFSTSREANKADDNEFVLREVEALLKAK